MTIEDVWTYRAEAGVDDPAELVGYDVVAPDGRVGSVREAGQAAGDSYLVVGAGPPIFGRKVLLPAGAVTRVDSGERKVFVARTRREIKGAPRFDAARHRDKAYHAEVGGYYSRLPGVA
jgi:hypothetical protein